MTKINTNYIKNGPIGYLLKLMNIPHFLNTQLKIPTYRELAMDNMYVRLSKNFSVDFSKFIFMIFCTNNDFVLKQEKKFIQKT